MKNNKKGFTLIELLAVIVILAIIALIATPIVLNIIAKARKSAAQDSLYGVMSAAKTTYMSTLLDSEQITLPMAVECDGSVCKVYKATEEADGTVTQGTETQKYGETGKEKDFEVSFSGTVPGTSSAKAVFMINKSGKIVATAADASLSVNGFSCTIDAAEKVTCS